MIPRLEQITNEINSLDAATPYIIQINNKLRQFRLGVKFPVLFTSEPVDFK